MKADLRSIRARGQKKNFNSSQQATVFKSDGNEIVIIISRKTHNKRVVSIKSRSRHKPISYATLLANSSVHLDGIEANSARFAYSYGITTCICLTCSSLFYWSAKSIDVNFVKFWSEFDSQYNPITRICDGWITNSKLMGYLATNWLNHSTN